MVRIEIKKVAEGQVALGMEAKEETPDEVLMCAARGFVGVASTVASVIPADAPFAARVKAASSIADMIATAVKQNFLEVVTGKAGKATVFTDKEAAFLSKLMGL